jgi:hypothetical protein
MSTLTQRFLNELDTNTTSMTDRETIAKQLEALTIAERELGATEYEAQRAAVQTVGKTLIPKPASVMRLPMIWQTAGIWAMVSYLLHYVYRSIIVMTIGHKLNAPTPMFEIPSIIELCLNFAITVAATCAAIAWDCKVGLKGALLCIKISIGFAILSTLSLISRMLTQNSPPSSGDFARWIPQMMLHNILGTMLNVAGVLVTPYLVKWWQKKKRRSL